MSEWGAAPSAAARGSPDGSPAPARRGSSTLPQFETLVSLGSLVDPVSPAGDPDPAARPPTSPRSSEGDSPGRMAFPSGPSDNATRDRTMSNVRQWLVGDRRRRIGLDPEDPLRDHTYRFFRVLIAAVSWFGLFLMCVCHTSLPDLKTENRFDSLWCFTLACQIWVYASSYLAVALILKFYRTRCKYATKDSIIPTVSDQPQWSFWKSNMPKKLAAEVVIHLIQPVPFFYRDFLLISVGMFLRLYLLFPLLHLYSQVYQRRFDMFGTSGSKYEVRFSTAMVLRVLLFTKITQFFAGLTVITLICGTFAIMIAERDVQPALGRPWIQSFWFAVFNFLTVGYTFYPASDTGRLVYFIIVLLGFIAAQLLGAVFTVMLAPTPIQEQIIEWLDVHERLQRLQIARLRVVQIFIREKLRKYPPNPEWPMGKALIHLRYAMAEYAQKTDKPDLPTKLDACVEIVEGVLRSTTALSHLTEYVRRQTNIVKTKFNKFQGKTDARFKDMGRLVEGNHKGLKIMDVTTLTEQTAQISGMITLRLSALEAEVARVEGVRARAARLIDELENRERREEEWADQLVGARDANQLENERLELVLRKKLAALALRIESRAVEELDMLEDRLQRLEHELRELQQDSSNLVTVLAQKHEQTAALMDVIYDELENYRHALAKFPPGYYGSLGLLVEWAPDGKGAFVGTLNDVTPGGPAAEAGLKVGDRVVQWDGHPLPSQAHYVHHFFKLVPLSSVQLTVQRGGQTLTVPVTVQARIKQQRRKGDEDSPTSLTGSPRRKSLGAQFTTKRFPSLRLLRSASVSSSSL